MKERILFCLNDSYSTTRCITRQKPEIKNSPEDEFETRLFLPPNPARKAEGGLRTRGYYKKSTPEKPLITIITVVYNGEAHLEETILSVLNQTYDNVEYIVIDGGSSDTTLEIVKKYEDAIDYYVSEPDGGIYYAMNKGIRLAMGSIIGLLNAGDFYLRDALKIVENEFCSENIDIVAGSIKKISRNSNINFVLKSLEVKLRFSHYAMPLRHPATFVKIKHYKCNGLFDVRFKIIADSEFLYRAYLGAAKIRCLDKILTVMELGGVSNKLSAVFKRAVEHFKKRKKHNYPFIKNYILFIQFFSSIYLKFLIRDILGEKIMKYYYNFLRKIFFK